MTKHNAIELETGKHYIDEHGFLYSKFSSSFREIMGKEQAIEHVEAMAEICDGVPRPFLIDGRGVNGIMTPEASRLLAKNHKLTEVRLAEAIVIDSFPMRILINLYIAVHQKNNPAKMFDNIEDAKVWLSQFLSNGEQDKAAI